MNTQIIFSFLQRLKENNNKDWFEANRKEYTSIRAEVEGFVKHVLEKLTPIDQGLNGLAVKDCMFRINRDIRFSPDKTPYKTNIGISFSPGGKNSGNPSYYLHIQPGDQSFIGGGMYMPSSEHLSKIRQEIDYNSEDFKNILNERGFKKFYPELYGEKLKKAPKGYPSDHPDIELLKFKHYVVLKYLTDEEVNKDGFNNLVVEGFRVMKPFNDFLKAAID